MSITNSQIANAFKAAKNYLKDGTEPWDFNSPKWLFICYAIRTAQKNGKCSSKAADAAIRVVERVLYPHNCDTVRDWLADVAKIPYVQLTNEAVQTYRHEWLDHLITEYSN